MIVRPMRKSIWSRGVSRWKDRTGKREDGSRGDVRFPLLALRGQRIEIRRLLGKGRLLYPLSDDVRGLLKGDGHEEAYLPPEQKATPISVRHISMLLARELGKGHSYFGSLIATL